MPGTARIAIPGTMGAPGDEGRGAMQIPPVVRMAISFMEQPALYYFNPLMIFRQMTQLPRIASKDPMFRHGHRSK